MLHLVDVPSCYPPHPGGLERYAYELHERLLAADPNLRITVLTSDIGSTAGVEVLSDRWTVVRWPAWQPVSPYPIPKRGFHALLRQYCSGPDTVLMTHTRFFFHAALVSRFAARRGLRRIHVEHGSTPVQSGNVVVRLVAGMVDRTIAQGVLRTAAEVVAVSDSAQEFVRELAGLQPVVVHRGMDLPQDLRSRPVADPPTLSFVGRLISGKGTADLLTALAQVRAGGIPAVLRICGDGPERAALERQAGGLGLTPYVTFLGAVDHATALREIAAATVFVNPSWTEGLPTTVLEAAAIGCGVVATAVGGTGEIMADGETGWLVPPRRPDLLAEALREAIDQPEVRLARARLLRARTPERFSWDQAVTVMSAMLRDATRPVRR